MSEETSQERRFTAAVRAENRPTFAALNIKRVILKKGALPVTFREPFDTEDDIAGARRRGEGHRGGGDVARERRGIRFETFELLTTVFRLRRLHSVMVATNKVFRLLDLFHPLFVSLRLNGETLGFERLIFREVPRIIVDGSGVQLECAICHTIEEIPIVADENDGGVCRLQKVFKPFGSGEIEVVGRFVEEHNIGLF